jgi:outer membrane autotransporter protein
LTSASFSTDARGATLGAEVQAGLHLTLGSAYLEPVVSVSHSQTTLGGFNRPDAAILVSYPRADSTYGSLGVRAGYAYRTSGYSLSPYVGLYGEGEFDGRSRVDVALGGVAVDVADPTPRARGRAELGVVAQTDHGLTGFIKLDNAFGPTQSGLDARIGLSWRW